MTALAVMFEQAQVPAEMAYWEDYVACGAAVPEAASRDAPRPQKGRTRLMMVVGVGAGQTAATVGKKVAEACALTPRAAAKGLAAGSFVAVSRDAQKNLLLWLLKKRN